MVRSRLLLLVCSILALQALAVEPPPVLRSAVPLLRSDEQQQPGHLLSGNFAGDAHPDLLVVDNSHRHLLVANGTGPFLPAVTTAWSHTVEDAVAADLNGDGRLDFAITDSWTDTIVVYEGNGAGGFTPGATIQPAHPPFGLTAADFNGDGRVDIAVAIQQYGVSGGFVAIYLGSSDGTFSRAGLPLEINDTVSDPLATDITGDGIVDLVITDAVFQGNGDGSFLQLTDPSSPRDYAAGDFNGDGHTDLAYPTWASPSYLIVIRLGNGDGTFAPNTNYRVGHASGPIAIVDIDGNGTLDVVAPGGNSLLSVLLGKGDGTFFPSVLYAAHAARQIVTADFDRDGRGDVITLGEIASNHGSVHTAYLNFIKGLPGGTLDAPSTYAPRKYTGFLNTPRAVNSVATDFNGDDRSDVLLRLANGSDSYLALLLSDDSGTLGSPTHPLLGAGEFIVADVTGDGAADVVMLQEGDSRTYPGNGDGTFQAAVPFTLEGTGQVSLADFDGDGTLDLLLDWSMYAGNGDGTFDTPITSSYLVSAGVGDLNHDGRADGISVSNGYLSVSLNDGTGRFPLTTSLSDYRSRSFGALGDFNGDSHLDVLALATDGTIVHPGQGDGTFAPAVRFRITPAVNAGIQAPSSPDPAPAFSVQRRGLATADFDGDGHLDFSDGTTVYLGDGAGRFPRFSSVELPWAPTDIGDFDGNGSPDILYTNAEKGTLTVARTRIGASPSLIPSLAVQSDDSTPEYARSVAFTATMGAAAMPFTGAVTFDLDGVPFAMNVLAGSSTITTAGLPVGSHTVTATYGGDARYAGGRSASTLLGVSKAATTMSAQSYNNPQNAGQRVTIVTSLTAPTVPDLPGPTGTRVLRDGGTLIAATPNQDGTFYVYTLTAGTHTITAEYPGDANYEASSASFQQVIGKLQATFTLSSPGYPLMPWEPLRYQVFFQSSGATGTITFLLDGKAVGAVVVANSTASMNASLPWGTYQLRARYSGDAKYAESESATKTFVVSGGPWGTRPAVEATATGSGSVSVQWSHFPEAASYTLYSRTSSNASWTPMVFPSNSSLGFSTSMPANTTRMYAVTATDANGNVSQMSVPDLATSVSVVRPEARTPIMASHVTELRKAVNAVRAFAGLAPFSFADAIQPGGPTRALHVMDLRGALSEARNAIGMPLGFSDPTLTPEVTNVRALHFQQLYDGVD